MEYAFGVDDLASADLEEEARAYLVRCGLTEDEVEQLYDTFAASAQAGELAEAA